MDEPTSGLDPNQLAEVRSLIKNIGKEKTVILSTHIMQEVQAICSRVIIINKGKIVADDSVDGIQAQQKGTTIIQVEFKEAVNQQLLKQIAGVRSIKGDTKLVIEYYGDADIREYLFRFAVENKYTLLNMHIEKQNLEDVFHDLTK